MAGSAYLGQASATGSRQGRIAANGIEIEYLEQGDGPSILMLHGFPDHAGVWRPLAERIASAFRVIAPNLRGYGQTSRPMSVEDYRLDLLVEDLAGLLDVLGLPQVHLCGHDWGGVLAFEFTARFPQRVATLTAFNAPPLWVLQKLIWQHSGQRAASQYVNLLRSPEADATFNEANLDALVERFLGEPLRRGVLDQHDLATYRQAWSQPGVWQAMLAWYRAAALDVPAIDAPLPEAAAEAEPHPLIVRPVLLIWGEKDAVFVPEMADAIAHACSDCRIERLTAAGHVPQRDDPDHCAVLVTDFLANYPLRSDLEE